MNRLEARQRLNEAFLSFGIEDAQAEARYGLSYLLDCTLSALFVSAQKALTKEQERAVEHMITERGRGVPLAYIMGERWFMGLRFFVDERVLIPRQDTELLVELAVDCIRREKHKNVLDLCTGSGCIAVAVAKLTGAEVTAADWSVAALAVCKENIEAHGVPVKIIQSNLFENIKEQYETILSNPPYVTEAEYEALAPHVRDHEPKDALLAGIDGLDFYRRIARQAPKHLTSGGRLMLEIGAKQAEAVCTLLEQAGFEEINTMEDLQGWPRVVTARRGQYV